MKSSLFFLILFGGSVSAQTRHARFFPVGDAPPFRQEIRDGVSYELEPPTGTIPPRKILVRGTAVSLRLGVVSPPTKVPAGKEPLEIRRAGENEDAAPWLRIAPPETGDFVTLLWRDAETGSWAKARQLTLPDDAPAGTARIVNVSPFAARVMLGKDAVTLAPGQSVSQRVAPDEELPFQVLLQETSGKFKRIHATNLVNGAAERTLAVIYRADAAAPRRPIKVTVRREPAPAPAPAR